MALLFELMCVAAPADAEIIAEGIQVGMVPEHGEAIEGFDDPAGIRWLRFRAACARAEMRLATDVAIAGYLDSRAAQADAEAAAREAAQRRMAA